MTRTRARLDGTSDEPPLATTSAIEESARKPGQFLQTSATQAGRSFDEQDLLAEPLETLEEIEKEIEEKLRQVRSAQNSKRADDPRAELSRLMECVHFGRSARLLPIADLKPSASQSEPEVNLEADSVADAKATDEVEDLAEPSLHVQIANVAGVTNAAAATQTANLRLRLRGALESSRCETATLLMILIYGLLVLFDLAIKGLSLDVWISVYLVVNALFLSIFMIEILMRLFVFGPRYCSNIFNLVDSTVIIFSFAITFVEVAGVNLGVAGSDGQGTDADDSEGDDILGDDMLKKLAGYLPLLRIGRLVTVIATRAWCQGRPSFRRAQRLPRHCCRTARSSRSLGSCRSRSRHALGSAQAGGKVKVPYGERGGRYVGARTFSPAWQVTSGPVQAEGPVQALYKPQALYHTT